MKPELKFFLEQMSERIDNLHMYKTLESPVFILSAPRSGSTLLMEQLVHDASIVTVGKESHFIYNAFPHLRAENDAMDSGRLLGKHADKETRNAIRLMYYISLLNHNGEPVHQRPNEQSHASVFVEKTPRNALNIPFLTELFPNARFVVLYREPKASISSLIEAWELGAHNGQFVSYTDLPGWHLPYWSFLLPRGWRSMIGKNIAEIATFQWTSCYQTILEDTANLDSQSIHFLEFDDLIHNRTTAFEMMYDFIGLSLENQMRDLLKKPLKQSQSTVSAPAAEKWRRHIDQIEPLLPSVLPTYHRLMQLGGQ